MNLCVVHQEKLELVDGIFFLVVKAIENRLEVTFGNIKKMFYVQTND